MNSRKSWQWRKTEVCDKISDSIDQYFVVLPAHETPLALTYTSVKDTLIFLGLVFNFPPAAAEVHDAMESYESKVVILNKQLVEMAMKTSSREKELNSEREIFNKQLQEAKEKAEELSAKLDEEQEKVRVHQEEYEEAILQLRQKCSELRSELKETRHVQNEELQEKVQLCNECV